jgi:hypothetical protein
MSSTTTTSPTTARPTTARPTIGAAAVPVSPEPLAAERFPVSHAGDQRPVTVLLASDDLTVPAVQVAFGGLGWTEGGKEADPAWQLNEQTWRIERLDLEVASLPQARDVGVIVEVARGTSADKLRAAQRDSQLVIMSTDVVGMDPGLAGGVVDDWRCPVVMVPDAVAVSAASVREEPPCMPPTS